ncbi:MAG: glycosyltransferase [Phycisphaerae bacterium]|nr:glycosyltransferase [Phycisphaerae bacterium]
MPVTAWLFVALAAIPAGYWAVVGLRLLSLFPRIPTIRDGLAMAADLREWPRVSIVVPAHNEERVIEACAASLLASDYPSLEVIVVLDRCTDRTLELLRPHAARDPRLTIVENGACPPDWAGKCNAARVGAERATGDLLLFTDADVQFAPELVRAAVGMLVADDRGLLSLLPSLVHEAWYERVVQPVAGMTLLRMYPIDKVNRDERSRPFANGQFLLFKRSTYEKVGGHAATKDDLLEDIAFARLVDAAGERVGIAVAEDLLVVHMYPSFRAMREGWKRIFIEACKRKIGRLRGNALRVLASGVLAPVAQAGAIYHGVAEGGWILWLAVAVVAIGVVLQLVALGAIYKKSRAPLSGVPFFPLGSAIVAWALWSGAGDLAARRPVRWGGRQYVLEPR